MKKESLLPYISSVDDIENPIVKNTFIELINKEFVLGIMLWGSRATQFGEPDTDYDALIYVTQEFFNSLTKKEVALLKFNEQITSKKLLIDFTYWSDSIFENQLQSPLDIDHAAYVEGIILNDKTGQLEFWRRILAEYPVKTHIDRMKVKWINLIVSFGYVQKNSQRNNEIDLKVNLFRTLTIAINLGFNLLKTWATPLKWWSKYAKKYGMDEELYNMYVRAITNGSVETTRELIDILKIRIEKDGIDLSTFVDDFFETIYPEGRNKLINYSYF